MLGNTLTLNLTEEDPKTLVKINNDQYSSEYRLDDGDVVYTAFVRHQTEKNKVNGQTMDRHQLLFRAEYRPTDIFPQGKTIEAYTIIRRPQSVPSAEVNPLPFAVSRYLYGGGSLPILGWES